MKGIYKITNLINRKVYIGQSDNLLRRERQHFYLLENNKHRNDHLQRAYDKYGKNNFIFECIEETKDLDNREIHWINEYGGINSKLNYNLKDPLTNEYSDYTRVKKSKSIIGKENPNYGRFWCQEQKDEASKKRIGVTLEERIGKEKADLAKEKMSKSQSGIKKHTIESKDKLRKANEGENNPAYGKGERQAGEKNPMWGKPSVKRKSVQQYTKEGILVKEYDYLSQVLADGFSIGNVGSVCNGKLNTHKGFIWKFKEEFTNK
jgi:group I intron endonuclease